MKQIILLALAIAFVFILHLLRVPFETTVEIGVCFYILSVVVAPYIKVAP